MEVSFFTKPLKAGRVSICIYCTWGGDRLRKATGERCAAKNWHPGKQRVKAGEEGYLHINQELDRWEAAAKAAYRNAGTVTPELIKAELHGEANTINCNSPLVSAELRRLMKDLRGSYSPGHLRGFRPVADHIDAYQPNMRLDQLTEDWLPGFLFYLQENDISNATARKYVQPIRSVLEAHGRTSDWVKAKSKVLSEPPVLFPEELELLQKYTPDTRTLKEVHACFMFVCYTGLRHGELFFKPDNIGQADGYRYLKIPQGKTKRFKMVVLSPQAEAIINQYAGQYHTCLPVKTIGYYNTNVKLLLQAAGLNRTFVKVCTVGNRVVEKPMPLWRAASSHTARHTCAVYMLNEGLDLNTIGKHLGHLSVKTTEVYARFVKNEVHRRVLGVWGKNGAENTPTPPKQGQAGNPKNGTNDSN